VQPPFAALAARKLAPGGYLHAATDWPDYAAQIEQVFTDNEFFKGERKNAKPRPTTKFERRGIRLGNPVRDLLFVRRQK
jgi:tRNA (guanine-N7-)-methyltransferase